MQVEAGRTEQRLVLGLIDGDSRQFLFAAHEVVAAAAAELVLDRRTAAVALELHAAGEAQLRCRTRARIEAAAQLEAQFASGGGQHRRQSRHACDGERTLDPTAAAGELEDIDKARRRNGLEHAADETTRTDRLAAAALARGSATAMDRIVLASTSRYRRELLARLRLPFEAIAPQVDERALAGESPAQCALRLARAKALAVAREAPQAIVIGSDQVADLDGEALNKPGSHAAALEQLLRLQGRTAVFHTAVCVAGDGGRRIQADCVPTRVRFRRLPAARLEAYLRADRPYDCAGAAKIESLGITLVEAVEGDDPTALIGLPLIRLTDMLAAAGVDLPQV